MVGGSGEESAREMGLWKTVRPTRCEKDVARHAPSRRQRKGASSQGARETLEAEKKGGGFSARVSRRNAAQAIP